MISFEPYTPEWKVALAAFNSRIAPTGFEFPTEFAGEATLAVEDGREVRGAYILRRQSFLLGGEQAAVAHYRLPLSEGTINRSYAMLGVQLLRHALQRQPMLYALGMGGMDRPLPTMLRAAGWSLQLVPFYFKVVHAQAFLRHIRPLRKTASRRLALDALAFSGAGWAALRLLQPRASAAGTAKATSLFGGEEDRLWEACREGYPALAWRDSATLNGWYGEERFHRLRVGKSGWVVVLDTQMKDDSYFGDLRLGTIVDGLALPGRTGEVVREATAFLEQRGVDLIVSNQSHRSWVEALEAARFRPGPSNFAFAASKALAARIGDWKLLHMNRGDGDGPLHL